MHACSCAHICMHMSMQYIYIHADMTKHRYRHTCAWICFARVLSLHNIHVDIHAHQLCRGSVPGQLNDHVVGVGNRPTSAGVSLGTWVIDVFRDRVGGIGGMNFNIYVFLFVCCACRYVCKIMLLSLHRSMPNAHTETVQTCTCVYYYSSHQSLHMCA